MDCVTDPRHHLYTGNNCKEVEVDGMWYDGELRSWAQADDGTWSAIVTWRSRPGEVFINRFPGRPDPRSAGACG